MNHLYGTKYGSIGYHSTQEEAKFKVALALMHHMYIYADLVVHPTKKGINSTAPRRESIARPLFNIVGPPSEGPGGGARTALGHRRAAPQD